MAIAAILREVGWFDHVNREAPARFEARARRGLEVCEGDENQTVLAATVGGEVVGYAAVHWFPNLLIGPEGTFRSFSPWRHTGLRGSAAVCSRPSRTRHESARARA